MSEVWRVLRVNSYNAAMNMAIDEAISEAIVEGISGPTIRFYTWNPSAVSIGYFQSIHDEVDVDYCKKEGIDIVRRRTGGGAVYHDSKGELTYSVIAPQDLFPKDIIKSYKVICGWIIKGLSKIGLKGEFRPINDIVVNERKISGNAQTRRNGVLLQHGTILYDLDVDRMFRCLKVGPEKIKYKMISEIKERVTSVRQHTDVGFDKLYNAMLEGFCEDKDWKFGDLNEYEQSKTNKLAKAKYSSYDWNFWR